MLDPAIARMQRKQRELRKSFASADFEYKYPEKLSLHPNSEYHDVLLRRILDRARAGHAVVQNIAPEWRRINESLNGYVYLDDAERALKRSDQRKPVRIVIPHLMATRETLVSAMASTFLSDTIHPLWGRGPEDAVGAAAMERVLQAQSQWFAEELALLTQWNDGFGLGVGAVTPEWKTDRAERVHEEVVDEMLETMLRDTGSGIDAKAGDVIRYLADEVLMEGNDLRNIDPFNLLLDPKASVNRIQKDAEFIGYGFTESAMHVLSREIESPLEWFNAKYVRMLAEGGAAMSSYVNQGETGRGKYTHTENARQQTPNPIVTNVDHVRLYIRLIPAEWGLSDETTPRIYDFCVAADSVILRAHPLTLRHNRFPVVVCAPLFDGHEVIPTSMLMRVYGIEQAENFYHTSHITNVRKTINDVFVMDPTKLDMESFFNMGPGRAILLKENVMGRVPIDQIIKQFPVSDVTRNHPADANALMAMSDRLMGVNDLMQGDPSNLPERPGQAGINALQFAGGSKMHRMARALGAQSMRELTLQMAFNTQQFMTQPMWVGILGRYEQELRQEYPNTNRALIYPRDLNIAFDTVRVDGAMPGQENAQAWTSIIERMLSVPEIALQVFSRFDGFAALMHWARINGARNLGEFQAQNPGAAQGFDYMPDQQVAQQAQAGNIVSLADLEAAAA